MCVKPLQLPVTKWIVLQNIMPASAARPNRSGHPAVWAFSPGIALSGLVTARSPGGFQEGGYIVFWAVGCCVSASS